MTWLLNPKVWIALALAVLLAATHGFVYRAGKATVRNEFDAFKLAQAEARLMADRAREQLRAARQAAADKEAEDGQKRVAALEGERSAAVGAADELRKAIRTAVNRSGNAPRAAAAGAGVAYPDTLDLLAKLYSESDDRAGALAGLADALRIAGSTCEATYDAVTEAR